MREMGYQVVSVDKIVRSKPDIAIDVLNWDFRAQFSPGDFELVAASVPCNEYSVAKKVGVRDMVSADKLVYRTLEIIEYLQPINGGLKILGPGI